MTLHPTAVIDPRAQLAAGVEVGPYAVIGAGVRIGRGTRVGAHAVIEGDTHIGEDNRICTGCVIGVESQIKAEHGTGGVRIGKGNIFREFVTVHASGRQGSHTVIGDQNFLMSAVHVAHDCVLGSHVTIANGTQLAGHVELGDHSFISGLAGIHQFVRVGEYAIVGGLTKLVTDVLPFSLCDGNPARIRGVNAVGLRRAGFPAARVKFIKKAIQTIYFSGLLREPALGELGPLAAESADVKRILEFVAASKRGIAPRAVSAHPE